MEYTFVTNGTTQLVLIPENDLDKMLLDRILGEGQVEIDYIRQPISVLGMSVTGGVIIRKQKPNDASQVEILPRLQTDETDLEKSW